MEKQNRSERRRNKFGGGRATEHGGWPTVQPNPVFTGDTPAEADGDGLAEAAADAPSAAEPASDKSLAGTPDQGQTAATGPGTGGATEQAGRAPRHEGAHGSNSTKG
jgi:hypothetical protein